MPCVTASGVCNMQRFNPTTHILHRPTNWLQFCLLETCDAPSLYISFTVKSMLLIKLSAHETNFVKGSLAKTALSAHQYVWSHYVHVTSCRRCVPASMFKVEVVHRENPRSWFVLTLHTQFVMKQPWHNNLHSHCGTLWSWSWKLLKVSQLFWSCVVRAM